MRLVFVYLPLFVRTMAGVLTDEEIRKTEQQLLDHVQAGAVVPGTGGVRKLRVATPGRGKSGSARIIYLHVPARSKVFFILVYAKNEKSTLTEGEKHQIQALVRRLKEEP